MESKKGKRRGQVKKLGLKMVVNPDPLIHKDFMIFEFETDEIFGLAIKAIREDYELSNLRFRRIDKGIAVSPAIGRAVRILFEEQKIPNESHIGMLIRKTPPR